MSSSSQPTTPKEAFFDRFKDDATTTVLKRLGDKDLMVLAQTTPRLIQLINPVLRLRRYLQVGRDILCEKETQPFDPFLGDFQVCSMNDILAEHKMSEETVILNYHCPVETLEQRMTTPNRREFFHNLLSAQEPRYHISEMKQLWDQLQLGKLEITLLVSLYLLPRLENLNLIGPGTTVIQNLIYMVAVIRQSSLIKPRWWQLGFVSKEFPKITRLELNILEHRPLFISELAVVLMIPSLREVIVKGKVFDECNDPDYDEEEYEDMEDKSGLFEWPIAESDSCNVEVLEISDCQICVDNMDAFITGMPKLTRLQLGFGPDAFTVQTVPAEEKSSGGQSLDEHRKLDIEDAIDYAKCWKQHFAQDLAPRQLYLIAHVSGSSRGTLWLDKCITDKANIDLSDGLSLISRLGKW